MQGTLKKSYIPQRRTKTRERDVLPPIRNSNNIKMNNQRRKKLSQTLTESYIQKFNDKSQRPLIQKEVENFLKREKVTGKDLKELENRLEKKIIIKNKEKSTENKLLKNTSQKIKIVTDEKISNNKKNLDSLKINENKNKENLNNSGMSGGSDLDKFDGKIPKEVLENNEMKELEEMKKLNQEPTIQKVELDTTKYNDEWDAINMYNKKMFEERRRREKEKDWEMKMRNRADLAIQIQEKIKRQYEQELKDKEYDLMIDKHLKKLDELEKQKKEYQKQQALKEKEMRDKQMRETYVNKRIDYLKNKKYEKELLEHNKEEIALAQKAIEEKKKAEKEALLKTLEDNRLHKQKKLEEAKLERENDIKIMEDGAANELKKENERKQYYENIKRVAGDFEDKMLLEVISKRDQKLLDEDTILKNYLISKAKLENEKEEQKRKEQLEIKKMLKASYDKQIQNKKARQEFERGVDRAQARIWEQDYRNYIMLENETKEKIRELSRKNNEALSNQVKYGKKSVDAGMSDFEKAQNKEALKQANLMEI